LYLENWVHSIIRHTLKKDAGFRSYAKIDSLGRIARSDVEIYQAFKLRKTLQYAYEKSSFYREWFDASGLRPEDICSPEDLSRLSFTEPRQLAEAPYRLLCVSQADIARPYNFVTSGTTGPRKRVFWSRADLERITDFMAAGIGTVATTKDVIHIILPDGRPYSQAELLREGVKKFGATPAVSAVDIGARELSNSIEEFHSTVIFGYARRLFRLSKELQSKEVLNERGVRVLFLAAEYLPDAMRKELEQIWNCRVHTHYGLTEMGLGVAVECSAGNGYHFNEADLLVEIVDPGTGVSVNPGEEGELVFTTLNREAMPLIRYRTHDISRLIVEPCSCGASTLLKIDKVKKRLESIVKVGDGDEMYPALFDDVLFEVPGIIDYQVLVTRQDNNYRLDFKIEMIEEGEDRLTEIRNKLLAAPIVASNIAAGKMLVPRMETVGSGALQSVGREKKMILDRREVRRQ
jgi:phenylacetate-CoA ligase